MLQQAISRTLTAIQVNNLLSRLRLFLVSLLLVISLPATPVRADEWTSIYDQVESPAGENRSLWEEHEHLEGETVAVLEKTKIAERPHLRLAEKDLSESSSPQDSSDPEEETVRPGEDAAQESEGGIGIEVEEGEVKFKFGERVFGTFRTIRPGQRLADEFNVNQSYNNGFVIADAEERYMIRIGGRLIVRHTVIESEVPFGDESEVKSARLYSNLNFFDSFIFRIQGEFSGSGIFDETSEGSTIDAELKDIYLEYHRIPWIRMRAGQFKVPYTWESLQSARHLDFADRSIVNRAMRRPSRDIGVMIYGLLREDWLQYQLAVLNGSGENTSDDNDAKDIAARLFFRPFEHSQDGILSTLNLGISTTYGDQEEDLSETTLRTIAGTTITSFTEGTVHEGERIRFGTELIWPIGPASIKSEWMWMRMQDIRSGTMQEDADSHGFYLSGTYLLTGETNALGRVVAERPFSLSKRQWGAWELAARYSLWRIDSNVFRAGMATGTNRADAYTFGVNWYPNEFFRVTFNYEHTKFGDDVLVGNEIVDDENAFLVQGQFRF